MDKDSSEKNEKGKSGVPYKRLYRNEFDAFAESTSVFRDLCGTFNCLLCFMFVFIIGAIIYSGMVLEYGYSGWMKAQADGDY